MQLTYPQPLPDHDAVAAVIKFNVGPDQLDRINRFLTRLHQRGIINHSSVETYCSADCGPVLYFP